MTDDERFLADLQRIVDLAHASVPKANAAPPETWQRALATVQAGSDITKAETRLMNTTVAPRSNPVATSKHTPSHNFRNGLHRYANLFVTITLMLAIAVGGWLVMTQLQPSDPGSRFAVLPATPADMAQTCYVEPLSVDRVMEIVSNPAYFMHQGPTHPRADQPGPGSPPDAELWEVETDLWLIEGNSVPVDADFVAASEVADAYLACLLFGTQGQVWTFYSPANIQTLILAEYPVYANETDVRAKVEERINEPAKSGEAVWGMLPFWSEMHSATVNSDQGLAIIQRSDSLYFDQVMMLGVSITDGEGDQLLLTNGTGRDLVPNDAMVTGQNDIVLNVRIARVHGTDNWFVIPWPSEAALGW